MHSSFDASTHHGHSGRGFLSLLGIAFSLVTAGVGLAVWLAAGG